MWGSVYFGEPRVRERKRYGKEVIYANNMREQYLEHGQCVGLADVLWAGEFLKGERS